MGGKGIKIERFTCTAQTRVVVVRDRNDAVDGMKGLSMAYIVGFWHLCDYSRVAQAWQTEVTLRITVVVLALFVLVSGYLVGRRPPDLTLQGIGRYYRGRVRSVYVPFAIALVVFYVFGLSGGWVMLGGLTLTSMLRPPAPPTLWFVTMVMLFYVAVPLLLWGGRKLGSPWRLAVLAAGVSVLGPMFFQGWDSRLFLYLPVFCMGIAMGSGQAGDSRLGLMMSALAVLPGWFVSWSFGPHAESNLMSLPMALAGSAALFFVFSRLWPHLPAQPSRMVLHVASISYFMYLTHRLVFELLSTILPQSVDNSLAWLMLVYLPVMYGVARLSQSAFARWVDPWLTRSLRLTPGR